MHTEIHFDLVRLCASTDADEQAVKALLARAKPMDWGRVYEQAFFHRVQPLVHRTLQRIAVEGAWASEQTGWVGFRNEARAAQARGQFGLDELHRVLRLFERREIPMLIFKGPVLGYLAYGEVGLRSSVDMDVLARPRDIDAVDTLLRDDGYRRLNADGSSLRRRIRFFFEREHHYAQGPAVYNLDVHTTPVKPSLTYQMSFEALHRRAQSVRIGQRDFLVPSTEDLLLILCYHGAKDRWSRLKRICDVNELVRRGSPLDWDTLLTRTEAAQGARILSLGLYLAQKTLGTPLPPRAADFVANHPSMMRWGDALASRLPHRIDDAEWGSLSERVMYPLAVQSTLYRKARYVFYAGVGKLVSVIM